MKDYYISNGKEKFGPLTESQVIAAVKKGQINLYDMILHSEISQWVMLMQHPDFSDLEISDDKESLSEDSSFQLRVLYEENRSQTHANELILVDDTADLNPICWYVQGDAEKDWTFLEMLILLSKKNISEHTLISKNNLGPWLPVIQWEEFSLESRNTYKQTYQADIPDIQLRRKFPRHICGKTFVFQTAVKLFKAFCLDTSQSGMAIVVRTSRCAVSDIIKIKFDDSLEANNFDAKGVVTSERKVRMPGSKEIFIRYGIRLTHFSTAGQEFILNQAKSRVT